MTITLLSRTQDARVEQPAEHVVTWWRETKSAWKEAPGRPPPPHTTTRTWRDFVGAIVEASAAPIERKDAGILFCSSAMDRGYRGAAHVEKTYGLTVDIDDAQADFVAVKSWFSAAGLAFVAQVRGGKIHVYIPIDPIASRAKFRAAARAFLSELSDEFDGVDLVMARPEQPTYVYAPIGSATVANFVGEGDALDLSAWLVPGAEYGEGRLPSREYLLAAAGQWVVGSKPFDPKILRGCAEPHRSILRACAAGSAPAVEHGKRNAALHAALWSLASRAPDLSPVSVAQSLALGGVTLDRDAEFAHAQWWHDHYQHAARDISIQRAAQALEDAEKGGAWVDLVLRTREGSVASDATNVALICCHDPDITPALAYNLFTDRADVVAPLPWDAPGAAVPRQLVPEREWSRAAEWLRAVPRVGALFAKGAIVDALEAAAYARAYDPLVDYLDGITWDGRPRIATWLRDHLGADDSRIVSEMGRRWLISAVARGLSPGAQVDSVLVLQGPQGLGKTSAFRILSRGWYSDRISDPRDKDSMAELQGSWIVEIAELESMRHIEISRLKRFLTSAVDGYRAAYGRTTIDRPRRFVFAASTNQDHYLSDPTGARRWWPVTVRRRLDHAALEAVRDQLWAEAVHEYRRGEIWYLDGTLEADAADAADERREESPWEEAIERWAPSEPFSLGEAMTALGAGRGDSRASYQIRDALTALGYECVRMRAEDGSRRRLWRRKRGYF